MSIRQTFTDIANAIREKTGNTGLLYPSEMAQNILDIPQGGGEDYLPTFIEGTANYEDYYSSIRNVSAIKPYAFYNNNAVIDANFPKVENIGDGAFGNCHNLTTVSFPMCSYVGQSAFIYCNKLRDAYFPVLNSVSTAAFQMCDALESVYAPNLLEINTMAFYWCSKLSNIDLPKVLYIGYGAFISAGILSASLPCVYRLDTDAFRNCESLTSVSMPNLIRIDASAFYGCTNLETVTLGAYSYSSIAYPSTLFSGCTNLKSIYVPSGALNYYQTDSRWSYWSDKIVPYDESDEYIYPYEYANNTTITEIPLNKQNAINLGYNAFLGCTNLKSVNLPNCRSIYSGVFSSHLRNSIEYVNIGVSLFQMSDFRDCSKLREVYAPNLVSYKDTYPFTGCENLEIVSLPSLRILKTSTFNNRTKLKTVYLYSLEEWNQAPFTACRSLESVYIGSNVTYVGGDCVPYSGSTKIYVPNDMVDTYKNGLFSWWSSRIYGY